MPIRVDNDVNALTLAESWYGAGTDYEHFVCISVEEGVGAGIVIHGDLYRGAFGGAGELGHFQRLSETSRSWTDSEGPKTRTRDALTDAPHLAPLARFVYSKRLTR